MPGLRFRDKDYDFASWTASDWRWAFRWNCVFLACWSIFFSWAILANWTNNLLLWAFAAIAMFGFLAEIANLRNIRKTICRLSKGVQFESNDLPSHSERS